MRVGGCERVCLRGYVCVCVLGCLKQADKGSRGPSDFIEYFLPATYKTPLLF